MLFFLKKLLDVKRMSFLLMQGIKEGENYILTQSPIKETVTDLWRLVNDYNSSTIVMLNHILHDQV